MNSFSIVPNYKESRTDRALSHIDLIVEFKRNGMLFKWQISLVCLLEATVS